MTCRDVPRVARYAGSTVSANVTLSDRVGRSLTRRYEGNYMRHSIRRGLVLAALAGTALVATAPAAFAQTTSPEAFGIEGTGLLALAPTPDATLATPNPANVASDHHSADPDRDMLHASVTTNSATASVAGLSTPIGIPLLGTRSRPVPSPRPAWRTRTARLSRPRRSPACHQRRQPAGAARSRRTTHSCDHPGCRDDHAEPAGRPGRSPARRRSTRSTSRCWARTRSSTSRPRPAARSRLTRQLRRVRAWPSAWACSARWALATARSTPAAAGLRRFSSCTPG